MAERKTPNKGYQKLKSDLSAGNIGQVYIFYGEESYLREYYLGEIKKKLVPAGFEEFNYPSRSPAQSSSPRALRSSTTTA